MSDDGKPRIRVKPAQTPVRGVAWSDDQRAEVGAELRRIERQRTSAVMDVPRELPPEYDPIEMTGPSDLVMADPVAREIWQHVDNLFWRAAQSGRKTADHVLDIKASHGGVAIDNLRNDVDSLKRVVKWLIGLLIAAVTAAAGSLITVGRELYDRGAHEGGDAVRLEHVERALDRMREDMRTEIERVVGRHSSLLPSESSDSKSATALTASKGIDP